MTKKSNDSVTVAFRLTPEEHQELSRQAEHRRQTAGTYARQVVLDAIQNRSSEALREEFRQSLTVLKQKLGLFATVALSNKLPLPHAAVKEWVKATWFDEDQVKRTPPPSHPEDGADDDQSAARPREASC